MILISNSSKETSEFGFKFAKKLKSGDTVLLFGELGSGKTTFVGAVAKGLGIKERILSPTFILHRSHEIQNSQIRNLNHIDLYRIKDPQEIEMLGLAEILDEDKSITFIEWADRLKNFKQRKGYKIFFKYLSDSKREIRIEKLT
jgi:tRNA threonylcarbamoyladenosine biosynthesis protein TsaE